MSLEDRLRAAFRSGEAAGPAPERAWIGIEERAGERARRRHRVRWAVWLAPAIVVVAGVPAFKALAPGGHRAQVVVTTPSPTGSPGTSPTPTVLPVQSCPVETGVLGETYPATPPTVTVAVPPGSSLAAYGGPLVILGPPGWDCQGTVGADGHQRVVVSAPGRALPPGFTTNTTLTVQAIVGDMPPVGTAGPAELACPFFPAAKALVSADGFPCPGPPAGESVSRIDAARVQLVDGPGLAGNATFSGGPNPARAEAFYDQTTGAAGIASCVVPSSLSAMCGPVLADFTVRYRPPAPAAVVPWAALALKPHPELFRTPSPAPTSGAPPCTAEQLRADATAGIAEGTEFLVREVHLTNIGSAPCLMSGTPTSLVGLRSSGQTVDLTGVVGGNSVPPGTPAPGIVAPGEAGVVRVGGSTVCTTPGETIAFPGVFASLRIGMPGGGAVEVGPSGSAGNGDLSFPCGAEASSLGVPDPVAPYETAPFQDLRITISTPATAVAGTTMDYWVTLHNPTGATIALTPCPGYVVRFGSSPPQFFDLNCAGAAPIPAGGEEPFVLKLPVPPTERGPVLLNVAFAGTPDAATPPELIGPTALPAPVPVTVVAPPP